MRALVVAGVLLLASCDIHLYAVGHRLDGPLAFEPLRLQDELCAEPAARLVQAWNGESFTVDITRGELQVIFECIAAAAADGGGVIATTGWFGYVPQDDVLFAAIALQRDLLDAVARREPGLPSASAFRVQWAGVDQPDGEELAAAKARWEAMRPQ